MVLFTDGVTESRVAGGELFGVERLTDVLVSCSGNDPGSIARCIHEAVTDGENETRDDVAILVVKATKLDE
jgi:serine phosphatase RsbU (regulator of sigma subunit)